MFASLDSENADDDLNAFSESGKRKSEKRKKKKNKLKKGVGTKNDMMFSPFKDPTKTTIPRNYSLSEKKKISWNGDFVKNLEESGLQVSLEIEKEFVDKGSFSSILFYPKSNILVTSCQDVHIRIIDSVSGKCYHKYKPLSYESDQINNLICNLLKWDENVFISCTYFGIIESFSLSKPFKKLKEFRKEELCGFDAPFYQLMRIDSDRFLVLSHWGGFLVVSYSQKIATRKLSYQCSYSGSCIIKMSPKYHNMFYHVSDWTEEGVIRLFNYEKPSTREFRKLINYETTFLLISSVVVSSNAKDEEILICGECQGGIYFYNITSDETYLKLESRESVESIFLVENNILMVFCFNRNLFYKESSHYGCLDLFYIDNVEVKTAKRANYSKDKHLKFGFSVEDIAILGVDKEGQHKDLLVAVNSIYSESNSGVKVLRIKNLRFKSFTDFERKDLDERVCFLIHMINLSEDSCLSDQIFEISLFQRRKKIYSSKIFLL